MIYRYEQAELRRLPIARKMKRNCFTTLRDVIVATDPSQSGVEVHGYGSFAFMNSMLDMRLATQTGRDYDYELVYYSENQREHYMNLRLHVVMMVDIGRMAGRRWYEMRLIGSTIHKPEPVEPQSIISRATSGLVEILGYGQKGGIYV